MRMAIRLLAMAAMAAGTVVGVSAPAQAADFTTCVYSYPSRSGFACKVSEETVPSRARFVEMYYDGIVRGTVSVKQLPDRSYRLEVCDERDDAIRPTLRWEDRSYQVHAIYPTTEGFLNCKTRETSSIRKWRGTWRDHGTQWFVWPVGA